MFATYSNPNYELSGNWDSDSGHMLLWFPVYDLSPEQKRNFNSEERTQKLLNTLGIITIKPRMYLMTSEDIAVSTASQQMPDIEKSASQLEGEGLVVVDATYLSQMGKSAMERCGLMIQNVYSDQLLARVQN